MVLAPTASCHYALSSISKQLFIFFVQAYPVMGVIVFAVSFCSGAMIYFTATHPDSRVSKVSRKSIFRGELRGQNFQD